MTTAQRHLPIDWRSVAPWFCTVVGASVVLLGLAMPWRVQPGFDSEQLGIDLGLGKLLFVAALTLGTSTFTDRSSRSVVSFVVMASAAVASLALTILGLAEVAGFGPGIDIGAGLWVSLTGSLVAIAGVLWRAVDR